MKLRAKHLHILGPTNLSSLDKPQSLSVWAGSDKSFKQENLLVTVVTRQRRNNCKSPRVHDPPIQ